ncbi:MAG: ammonium transporter, Amt family, partial [Myxococcales bacterium]|nr:ammonium transporter, Amt family [Myxococcales bacterium]
FYVIGKVLGSNRVSAEVEIAGLDVPEMGMPGYPEFMEHITPADVPATQVAAAKKAVPSLGSI